MQEFLLGKNVLFQGIEPQEIEALMHCLRPIQRRYQKNEVIWQEGDCVHTVGMVTQGKVLILRDDFGATAVFWEKLPQAIFLANPMPVRRDSRLL